ncbi:MAG: hypothetical protein HY422_01375 [Candidatus Komeilibacteria bacterium]|nr:hypothetical protein [Candidatus Komeilibacteria bacterium]
MRALVRVERTDEELTGSFFTGEIITGILSAGMEAITALGPIEVKRITARTDMSKIKKRALPSQRVIIHLTDALTPNQITQLYGEELEFSDQKTIPLKKGIFLSPEIG